MFLPFTSCCGANCLQEGYDQCFNTENVAPWVYHTVILASGSALWVLRSEPELITELVYEVSTLAITAEGDPQYHFYKVTGKENISAFNHRWLWHRISPNTDILQGHFYVRENIIDMTCRVVTRKYTCVVTAQSIRYTYKIWSERNKERQSKEG